MNSPANTPLTNRQTLREEDDAIGKYTASFGLSLGITGVLNALLVILKETNEATVLEWMKNATGHHWITQGVLNLAIFLVLGLALAALSDKMRLGSGTVIAVGLGGVIAGSLIIAGFFA